VPISRIARLALTSATSHVWVREPAADDVKYHSADTEHLADVVRCQARGTTVWTIPLPAGRQTYWYFSYAFWTSAGVWEVGSEYAKGMGSYGWYDVAGGAYNYMSDTVCRT
jgi:hypothetical protein